MTELQKELETQKKQYNSLYEEDHRKMNENKNLRQQIKDLKKENSSLKKNVKRLQSKSFMKSTITDKLNHIFTKKQIHKILNPHKKKIKWNIEDISLGIGAKSISTKAYRFWLSKNYPLPGVSTLRNCSSQMNLKEGILKDVLHLMSIKGQSMSLTDKLAVLTFDEIYVSQKVEIDRKLEQVVGPHRTAQIGMVRGLFSKWKQPIFYKFDQKITVDILNKILSELWDIGYIVVAVTTDLGGNNPDAFKKLNIGVDENQNCFFNHPKNKDHKVFVFADVPHLIKLFRNHFLDNGYIVDNKYINKKVIEELIALNRRTELKVSFKVSEEHIDVSGPKRQNVSLATKLISKTTARSILWAGKNGLLTYEDWQKASEVIELMNDWFDIFNSKLKFGYTSGQEPYGKKLSDQNKILDEVTSLIKKMKIGNHNKLIPFQRGIIMNNKSLKLLLPYLQKTIASEPFKIQYLLTNRLNQDCLENLFSYLRAMGLTNDHPTALNLRYLLKWYILGKHSELILSKKNAKNTESDETDLLVDFNNKNDPLMKYNEDPLEDEDHLLQLDDENRFASSQLFNENSNVFTKGKTFGT